jgi:hypothetical protein
MSISNHGEAELLEAVPDEVWVKLHKGDPGEEGTANAATETTRKKVTLGAAASSVRKSTGGAEWAGVSTTEEYDWISLWDASAAGNCWWVIQLEAGKSVTAGDTFKLPAEDISIALD